MTCQKCLKMRMRIMKMMKTLQRQQWQAQYNFDSKLLAHANILEYFNTKV